MRFVHYSVGIGEGRRPKKLGSVQTWGSSHGHGDLKHIFDLKIHQNTLLSLTGIDLSGNIHHYHSDNYTEPP